MFTGDGLGASAALLGEQFPVAVRAVGLVVLGRELLLSQLLVTLGTSEALTVPGLVLVGHAPLVNHLSKFEYHIYKTLSLTKSFRSCHLRCSFKKIKHLQLLHVSRIKL